MTWSPAQYTVFEAERTRPVRDLLAQLPPTEVRTAIDLGCGPGNSTEVLATRFPGAAVSGLDSSPDMLATARKRLPSFHFELADISEWARRSGATYDVVFANAALQWVPDHETLLPSLLGRVALGGCLAVQVPDNLHEPSHRLMRETASAGPWAAKLASAADARGPSHTPDWYYRTLQAAGAEVDVWRTTYFHRLAGAAGIVEWFMSTGLRPFIQPLADAEQAEYLRRYRAALSDAYPALPDGDELLPFPRLFLVARKLSAVGRSSSKRDEVRQ